MARYVVGTVDEIPPGGRKLVEVAGRSVGVFNLSGEFFALRNRCPHEGGPLCMGPQVGWVFSEQPGDYQFSREGEILRCPWHGWEFDIRTGQSWFDPQKVRVRSYPVSVETPPAGVEPASESRLSPGPYLAETYDVAIEQQVVLVEIPD